MGHLNGAMHLAYGCVGLELWILSSEIYIWEVNSTLTINKGNYVGNNTLTMSIYLLNLPETKQLFI